MAMPAANAQAVFSALPVGSSSTAQTITVKATVGGVVNAVAVNTQGSAGLDFSDAGASTCAGATLAAGQSCTVQVLFKPSTAGARAGAVVLLDASGYMLGSTYLSGVGQGGLAVLTPGQMKAIAGQYGLYTGLGDGLMATAAQLYLPKSLAIDGVGNLYIADSLHHRIRMICSAAPPSWVTGCTQAGILVTVAGNGSPAYTGDGALAAAATVNAPEGIALDGAGNLYIADTGNNAIRVIATRSGVITTFAGNGSGTPGFGGDNGQATAAQVLLNLPAGVSVDTSGNVYIADTDNHRIRRVDAATRVISTIAGSGYTTSNGDGDFRGDGGLATAARLNYPHAVAFDSAGNMYIPDTNNNRVRKVLAVGGNITAGSTISTLAGTGTSVSTSCTAQPSLAATAGLSSPTSVAVDAADNIYIADTQSAAIREVNHSSGKLLNLAVNNCLSPFLNGNASPFTGGQGTTMYGTTGIALDGKGNLFFADSLNMVVAEIFGNAQLIDYSSVAVRQGTQSTTVNQYLDNNGNVPLNLSALTAGTNTALDAAVTTCIAGTPYLAVSDECRIGAIFAPQSAGNPLTGNISVVDDAQPGPPEVAAANSPVTLTLSGNALAVNSTTTTIASLPNPSSFGQNAVFTVTVVTGKENGTLSGTVSISDTYNGSTSTLASALPIATQTSGASSITATFTYSTTTLGVGVHKLVASYSGDTTHFSSLSTDNNGAVYTHVVNEATSTLLTSSANPSVLGANVTFTAQVAIGSNGGGVAPDGNVTFSWGSTAQSVAIDASGKASYSTAAMPNGVTTITAAYGGNSSKNISGGQAQLNQDVQVSDTMGITSSSPSNTSAYGSQVTFTAAISTNAVKAPTGTVTFKDNGVTIGTGSLSGNPAVATFTTGALAVGSHSITASYAGDSYNTKADAAAIPQTVTMTQTATAVSASPAPGVAGGQETLTATVTVTSGAATVTGTVTFTSGTTTLGVANVGSNGSASLAVTLLQGSYPIVATYSGDSNNNPSTSATYTLVVNQAATQTVVTVTPNPAIVAQQITVTAKVTSNGSMPTGTVSFLSGANTLGTATLSNGTATFTTSSLAAGTYSISAVYAGDTNNTGSTAAAVNLTVATIATTTALGSSSTGGLNAQTILVATVVNNTTGPVATGTVTFTNGTTTLGTATLNSNGVATLLPNLVSGTNYSIVATYGGDVSHAGSASPALTLTATSNSFDIKISPATVSIPTKQNRTVSVTFTSYSGFADTITLGCAGMPSGMSCHFAPASVTLTANSTTISQLTIDTNNPIGGGASAMNHSPAGRRSQLQTALAGVLLPGGIFLGLAFWRRRRMLGLCCLMLAMMLSAMTLSGCGNSISVGSVAPGSYTLEVTGTGTSSNVIHYQTIAVDVTN